jgi:hypothetical protein
MSVADLEFHWADALVAYSLDSEEGVVRRTEWNGGPPRGGYVYDVCSWDDVAPEVRDSQSIDEVLDFVDDDHKIPPYLWKEVRHED